MNFNIVFLRKQDGNTALSIPYLHNFLVKSMILIQVKKSFFDNANASNLCNPKMSFACLNF
jgi:hypothetical protein